MEEIKKTKDGWVKALRGQFMAGLVAIIPLGATILILVWLFTSIDKILQPLVRAICGHNITGVGFGVAVVLIYVVGVIARNVIGKRLVRYFNSLLERVPIFRLFYRSIRQILDSFSTNDKAGFLQVVLVEFPKKGMRTIGFVTNETTGADGKKLINVLIPNAPNPMTGFLEIVREEDIIRTQISVDAAMKMIVSAGRMTPGEVQTRMVDNNQ